ncbi:helix-turn-helix domain-containing protein [Mariniflexile jejuense]|uniref:Helix-turn-helix domain-containing protein n=1 Tax=Mariniflexile jejuense TaxID=1173582 RepID=A0ABW3JEH4_9FLAO
MNTTTIKEFYQDVFKETCPDLDQFLNNNLNKDLGHFNVFNIESMYATCKTKPEMPYNRRTYYKVSLISGKNIVEYADKTIEITKHAILFATPKTPYRYTPKDNNQSGHFCVFTKDFVPLNKTGFDIDNLQIFSNQSDFVFQISKEQYLQIKHVFEKMHHEINSNYELKYDLLRNYLMELIHYGQKLTPFTPNENKTAATRITGLFIELLERQFPIENATQLLQLKKPNEYANALNIHINHLNKVLKDTIGKTTSDILSSRINQEAKILLKQTDWNVSEIAYSLGFDEVAHFSNFFKKHNKQSPLVFRK